jgi:hypothetical protein
VCPFDDSVDEAFADLDEDMILLMTGLMVSLTSYQALDQERSTLLISQSIE